MEVLQKEHERLLRNGNLEKSIDDVQKTIDLLTKARDSIAASMFSIQILFREHLAQASLELPY